MRTGWIKRLHNLFGRKKEPIKERPLCVLYKDEGGVFSADPKICPEARLIPEISYNEMMEMGSQGAKVVHPRATAAAERYGVVIYVTSMEDESKGTFIH